MHKYALAAVVLAVAAASIPAAALASHAATAAATSNSYVIKATLDAKHQVPTPKDAAGAKGLLTES